MPPPDSVTLTWLDGAPPPRPCGVSWGVPWLQGEAQKGQTFALTAGDGKPVPVQSWPLAFWSDGSLKWTGHAASVGPETGKTLQLAQGAPTQSPHAVRVQETADGFTVDTGVLQCRIPRAGEFLLTALSVGGRVVAQNGRLVCLRENRSRFASERIMQEEEFTSHLDSVTLEQSGPVRAVVKIMGRHRSLTSERAWLPFVVRLYFFAGLDTVRMAHSFVFDGDQEQDFIRGLGVRFDVPLREELHNRHVRLSGEHTGLFAEPVRVIAGRRNPTPDLYARQIAGQPIPTLADLPNSDNVAMMAAWDDWKLAQTSAEAFSIQKRTGAHSAWISAAAGTRSPGLAFVGDTSGGLALGMQNFWQLAPTALEIAGATTDMAQLTLWLWTPDAPAMDLRHYDIAEHGLEASYEDIEPGWSTATGIARTTEITMRACAEVPANAELLTLAHVSAQPPRLVCTPERYHRVGAFGVWS
ncbi:MAG: Tat pathway signal sequence domain protein, partial [Armatimonadota bacterium]|nr:Tat pathway signal sequence domain protein [Armatimonadota bacterium]